MYHEGVWGSGGVASGVLSAYGGDVCSASGSGRSASSICMLGT